MLIRWQDSAVPARLGAFPIRAVAKTDYIDPIVCADVISCFQTARLRSPGNVLVPVLQGKWIFRNDSDRAASTRTQVSSKQFPRS